MDKKEFLEMMQNIGTCEDDVQRRSMLADLQEDIENVIDTNEKLTTDTANQRAEIERLQGENMKLYLKVTSDDKEPDDVPPAPKEKRKFEDLFNDNGGIK